MGSARRVGFGGPSGPALPSIANSKVQYSKDVGISTSLVNNDNVCDDVCGSLGFHPARFSLLNPRYFGSGSAGLGLV
jgi:hypothetical protein